MTKIVKCFSKEINSYIYLGLYLRDEIWRVEFKILIINKKVLKIKIFF